MVDIMQELFFFDGGGGVDVIWQSPPPKITPPLYAMPHAWPSYLCLACLAHYNNTSTIST